MNKDQRKQIAQIIDDLGDLRDQEQDKIDNMEETLSGTQRYEDIDQALGYLDEAIDALNEIEVI